VASVYTQLIHHGAVRTTLIISTMATMLEVYIANRDFLEASSKTKLGESTWKDSQEKHVKQLKVAWSNTASTIQDHTATLQALDEETVAFTPEQREDLKVMVANHGVMCAGPSLHDPRGSSKTQTHLFMYNYLSDQKWDMLVDPNISEDDKLSALSEFMLDDLLCELPSEEHLADLHTCIYKYECPLLFVCLTYTCI
jgi:hypothetical protein